MALLSHIWTSPLSTLHWLKNGQDGERLGKINLPLILTSTFSKVSRVPWSFSLWSRRRENFIQLSHNMQYSSFVPPSSSPSSLRSSTPFTRSFNLSDAMARSSSSLFRWETLSSSSTLSTRFRITLCSIDDCDGKITWSYSRGMEIGGCRTYSPSPLGKSLERARAHD